MPTRKPLDEETRALKGLHLYHAKLSNNSMRVRLLLEEKGLPWVSHLLDARRQDNLTETYLRINPASLIPALVHDGEVVTESNDILYYLEERFPESSFFAKEDAEPVRTWVDLAAHSHATTLKPWMYAVTGMRTKRPEDMARYRRIQSDSELVDFHQRSLDGFSQEDLAEAIRRNHQVLARMEAALCAGPWLAGRDYGLADIAWLPNVLLLDLLGFPTDSYPAVRTWLSVLRRRRPVRRAIGASILRLPRWLLRPVVPLRRRLLAR